MANSELTQWVEIYTSDLYSWAYHKTSNVEVAQDLVQDTFLAATERIDSFQRKSSVKTWLFSILNNKIVDFYRKKTKSHLSLEENFYSRFFNKDGEWKKESMPMGWEGDDEHLLDNLEFHKVLKSCMDALPESWNTTVKMKYLLQKRGEDICKELGITSSNYWQMIHRAKLQLRDCLQNKWIKQN
ncbi:sigma-70 family RNA polymerase sigma factor [Labilibacter sediminis]|nr:sigma-70 family RNA polymerase sigma factor [Labilibacter sediminis]